MPHRPITSPSATLPRPALCLAILAALPSALLVDASAWSAEAPVATLEPVIVTSTRTDTSLLDTPASVDIVDGTQMRDGQLQINLSETLNHMPGIQVQNRQNYAQDLQISVRGFGARSTFGVRGLRLYVDGIPATMPDGQGQTSNIDIATIDRVEVLRGPFSALYGNSSGGVIQVFTEDGASPPTLGGSFAVGSDRTYRYGLKASGRHADDAFDYTVGTTRYTTDGYRDHSGARRNLGNAKLGLRLGDDSRLTVTANHVDLTAQDPLGLTRQQYEDDPRSVAAVARTFNTRKTVTQTQGGLHYERNLNTTNDISLMVYYGRRATTQFLSIPAAPQQQQPLHAGGVIDLERRYGGADLRWTTRQSLAGRPLTLNLGLAYDTMTEDRQGHENFIRTPTGERVGVRGGLRRDETNKVYNIDPYLQASWAATEKLTLDAGLRYSTVRFSSDDHYIVGVNGDDSGTARYRKALPVAAVTYAATPDLNLYAAYGRGFETPTFNEISYRPDGLAGLNFDLRPATNINLEVGAKLRAWGGLFTAAVFDTRTQDEIVTAFNRDGRSTFQNAGRTRRQGVELSWDASFARDWHTRVGYTWLDARYREDVCTPDPCGQNNILAGNRIPGIARHAAFAVLAWAPAEGWRASADLRYMSSIPVDDANSDAAPAYVVAGVGAGYLWRNGAWKAHGYARVDNLFDRRYAGSVIVNEGNGRYFEPAPGRNWSAGLSLSYAY